MKFDPFKNRLQGDTSIPLEPVFTCFKMRRYVCYSNTAPVFFRLYGKNLNNFQHLRTVEHHFQVIERFRWFLLSVANHRRKSSPHENQGL